MNDRLDHSSKITTGITVNRALVDNFVTTVKNDHNRHGEKRNKPALFVASFRVLLEEHGLEPSDEPKFTSFWENVQQLANSYHQPYSEGFGSVDEMVARTRLDKDVARLIQEYYRLFYSDADKKTPPDFTIGRMRRRFRNEEMQGL